MSRSSRRQLGICMC